MRFITEKRVLRTKNLKSTFFNCFANIQLSIDILILFFLVFLERFVVNYIKNEVERLFYTF